MSPAKPPAADDIVFFPTPADLRRWFEEYGETNCVLHVGYYKKGSGRPSVTWPESVDEALCFGWIDGIRRSLGDESYTIRFTPRKPESIWSAVNLRRAEALIAAGRMRPAGLAAFERRREYRSGVYSYEQRSAELPEPYASRFRKEAAAWTWFQAQPASYRKMAMWYVVSAKREETRLGRLENLIAESTAGRRLVAMAKKNAE